MQERQEHLRLSITDQPDGIMRPPRHIITSAPRTELRLAAFVRSFLSRVVVRLRTHSDKRLEVLSGITNNPAQLVPAFGSTRPNFAREPVLGLSSE